MAGLERCGYRVTFERPAQPAPGDVLLIWNRYGHWHDMASRFAARGCAVLVAENGYLGRDWRGGHWYALARDYHNGAGRWPVVPGRWASWGVELAPWREAGDELVLLNTRGIGPRGVAQPASWLREVVAALTSAGHAVRVREHPGERPAVPLEDDLARAWAVVTWGSGGALKALTWGVPVFYGFPCWIGAPAGRLLGPAVLAPRCGDRLPMFERLAGAMWNTEELATGAPFRALLGLAA